MKKINSIGFNKASIHESRKNDLSHHKDQTLSFIEGIKSKISSLDLERGHGHGRQKHDRSEDSFDLFRMAKRGFVGIIKMFQKTGLINQEDFEDKKDVVKELFKESGKDLKKMFYKISQRDLESVIEFIDGQIESTEQDSKVNYEQEEISEEDLNPANNESPSQSEETKNNGEKLKLTLSSTLKFNNLGNSLLNLLNKVDPFNSPDEVAPENKDLLKDKIGDIHSSARELILSLDPSLKGDLDKIDKQVQESPDKKEAYLNYAVAMVPIDIASKAIDVVNNEREGFQNLADIDRKTLAADMLDFYEYLSNLNQNTS